MAKVVTDDSGRTHLRGKDSAGTLCQGATVDDPAVTDGELTCVACAAIALAAIETSTKAERREWRKL